MSGQVCRFEVLASRGIVSVHRCADCGGITLHVACVSIRLDASSFDLVADTVLEARRAGGIGASARLASA